jgi:hypothetical protein
MHPAHPRGQAYFMLYNGAAATAEFKKFVDHPEVVLNFSLGTLARLQIAHANPMGATTPKQRVRTKIFSTSGTSQASQGGLRKAAIAGLPLGCD